LKQGSYTGQNWGRSQSTLSTGLLPMRKYKRIPVRAWFYSALFIGLVIALMFVGAAAGY